MDEFGIETREGNPPELGGSELMPSAHARSDEPDAKTSSTQDVEAGATSLAARPTTIITAASRRRAAARGRRSGARPSRRWAAPATPTSRAGSAEVISRYFAEAERGGACVLGLCVKDLKP